MTLRGCSSFPYISTGRSEEHTSELQSRVDLVCRLLLEKKKEMDGERLGEVLAGGVASAGHDLPVGLVHDVVDGQFDDAAYALRLQDGQISNSTSHGAT